MSTSWIVGRQSKSEALPFPYHPLGILKCSCSLTSHADLWLHRTHARTHTQTHCDRWWSFTRQTIMSALIQASGMRSETPWVTKPSQQARLCNSALLCVCVVQYTMLVYCLCRWSPVMQHWLSGYQRSCFHGAAWLSGVMALWGGWRGTGSFRLSTSPRTHEDSSPRT